MLFRSIRTHVSFYLSRLGVTRAAAPTSICLGRWVRCERNTLPELKATGAVPGKEAGNDVIRAKNEGFLVPIRFSTFNEGGRIPLLSTVATSHYDVGDPRNPLGDKRVSAAV